MVSYLWKYGSFGYDHLIGTSPETASAIADHFHASASLGRELGGYYWFLISDKHRVVTPLTILALAFGGQYNDDPPYGNEDPCHFSLDNISEYRLELDWRWNSSEDHNKF